MDWSSLNVLSVGLGTCVYLWSACTSQVGAPAPVRALGPAEPVWGVGVWPGAPEPRAAPGHPLTPGSFTRCEWRPQCLSYYGLAPMTTQVLGPSLSVSFVCHLPRKGPQELGPG